ncbi:hypothetical protein [Thauera sinica]|uniref:Uncharacterized protein n=1 Tax=Thauera sinica TaxID=2665146 RepID=A0ABW1AWD1_9RHOO|nr:hypothetical protein [Thauera sp. K11]
MEPKINRVLMGLGLLAGLLIGVGHSGGAMVVVITAATAVWLLRSDAERSDRPR